MGTHDGMGWVRLRRRFGGELNQTAGAAAAPRREEGSSTPHPDAGTAASSTAKRGERGARPPSTPRHSALGVRLRASPRRARHWNGRQKDVHPRHDGWDVHARIMGAWLSAARRRAPDDGSPPVAGGGARAQWASHAEMHTHAGVAWGRGASGHSSPDDHRGGVIARGGIAPGSHCGGRILRVDIWCPDLHVVHVTARRRAALSVLRPKHSGSGLPYIGMQSLPRVWN